MSGVQDLPHITFAQLSELNEGLIVLSGGEEGPLNVALADNRPEVARQNLLTLSKVFGDRFYIELQRHQGDDPDIEKTIVEIGLRKQRGAGRHQPGLFCHRQ